MDILDSNYHLGRNFLKNPITIDGITLHQIGRLYCKPTTVIDTHIFNLFELTIVTGGKGKTYTNGVAINLKAGDIHLSLPCDYHKIESDKTDPLKYDFFAFTCDNEIFKSELELITEKYCSPNTRIFHEDRIPPIISQITSELNNENLYSLTLLKSLLNQVLIYLIRGFKEIESEKYPDKLTSNEILCHRIMDYIDTHIYSLKNLKELSAVMGYSYGYLSSVFSKTTSNTLTDYFQTKRLEIAKHLIIENRLKIVEIAEMFNFSSLYSFSKAFTNHFGISPRNYRNNSK